MARRSYNQLCGLAAALDVTSQRWAMLIVRDLVPGPRRFTDLFEGLPGVSTDILAQRLRELDDAGAIRKIELRDPAPVTLYELTERGRELATIGAQLARWGMPLLQGADRGQLHSNPRWALQSIASRCASSLPEGVAEGYVEFVIDGSTDLSLALTPAGASIRYGRADEAPIARVECTSDAFFAALARPGSAADTPDFEVDGDLTTVQALLGARR